MIQGESDNPHCNPEAGENLMIRRTLCSEKLDEEPAVRRSIFKTRCKVVDKCCKMIIDSGSSANLASEELIIKYRLQRLRHLEPYHVSWIKDEHKVMVSEQCIVKFKIGCFHDEVLCDIMPMDCCHIFLGRL